MNTDAREFAMPSLEEMVCYVATDTALGKAEYKLVKERLPDLYEQANHTYMCVNTELQYLKNLYQKVIEQTPAEKHKSLCKFGKAHFENITNDLRDYRNFAEGFLTAADSLLSNNGKEQLRASDDALLQAVYTFRSVFIYYWEVTALNIEQVFEIMRGKE